MTARTSNTGNLEDPAIHAPMSAKLTAYIGGEQTSDGQLAAAGRKVRKHVNLGRRRPDRIEAPRAIRHPGRNLKRRPAGRRAGRSAPPQAKLWLAGRASGASGDQLPVPVVVPEVEPLVPPAVPDIPAVPEVPVEVVLPSRVRVSWPFAVGGLAVPFV